MHFVVSGVDCPIWLPPLVAFVVSFFTSMGGVSGAFLLLPFQMSFLGFTSPAVSPTNLVYNIVSIPSGVWRYLREGRMVWPLTWVVIAGTLPGVVAGGFIRLTWLPDPGPFKVFVGCVLLYIGARMFWDLTKARSKEKGPLLEGRPALCTVDQCRITLRELSFSFAGQNYACSTPGIFLLSLAVGMVGGVYGIGGGSIVAPFFVAVYGLPVHAVAGAALMGTFVTSVVGVAFYQAIAPLYAGQMAVAPDWLLGLLFGLGGVGGMYCGARMQKRVKPLYIKIMLGLILLGTAGKYLVGYFMN
ncbi:MAG: sulfite exporter TauE/SafE family protein [Proteobacteria bacterium]|nr:sulfite exporter TauE/SafE family protein [Pseudomonadota bacterium]MBU4384332.1 sulfite exporter TauE/SafE family protein [Pseudomonadota bacterium]MBU4606330.1 sulfite exporter TauE/SafE family protein [Pseudomonadota bacterium]MCG2764150.1 sulfite exporter TauE/SafE family protein [Desulfarculaceae bacterium]